MVSTASIATLALALALVHADKRESADGLVQIQACKSQKVLSEFYSDVYADVAHNTANEHFEFKDGQFKVASNGECLDVYADGAAFKLHTYKCDASNNNQKWYVDGKAIKHSVHKNICLDVDPTDKDHKAQVWQCYPNAENQCFDLVPAGTTPSPTTATPAPTTATPTTSSPVPTGVINIQGCTSKKVLSEFYSEVYSDVAKGSANEQFEFKDGIFKVASNGECLDAYPEGDKIKLHTYKCDANNSNQKWVVDGKAIKHATHKNVCLDVDPTDKDHKAQVYQCYPNAVNQCFDIVPASTGAPTTPTPTTPKPSGFVSIEACKTKKVLSEFYSEVYADVPRNTTNEKFEFKDGLFKVASNGECLDAYPEGDKIKLHTYKCDANNGNQKWVVDGKAIKHATHKNICLDVDPTDKDHKAQVWQCYPNAENQCFNLLQL